MDIDKYIYSHCANPVKVKMRDPYTLQMVSREVPCGKCYHCKISRINEWVTRMCLESRYRKCTYFVTLTYDNDTKCQIIDETHPVYNNNNLRKTYAKQPLHIVKKHLQNFIKRLRKSYGQPLKYFACGEYGTHYSRPHYHLILWTDLPLSRELIERSWSYIDSDKNYMPIGNIDFNDLVLNGTLDSNAATCSFKYVCKYLNKRDYDIWKSSNKNYHYEYLKQNYLPNYEHLADAKRAYSKDFSPFILCSKQPAIGYDYFNANRDAYCKGDFRLFGCSEEEFIFPRYYLRKAKEVLNPYKGISQTNQKPLSCSSVYDVYTSLIEILNTKQYAENCKKTAISIRSKSACVFDDRECRFSGRDFYDTLNKEHYQFNGVDYSVFQRKKFIRTSSIDEVLNKLENSFNLLLTNINKKLYFQRQKSLEEFNSMLVSNYGSKVEVPPDDINYKSKIYDLFINECREKIVQRDDMINSRQSLYYQTKNKF